jgi:hypothetical protein
MFYFWMWVREKAHTRIRNSCPLFTSRIFDLIVLFAALSSLNFASEGLERMLDEILIRVWMSVGLRGDDR